jgi:hypothetical protein
MSTNDAAKVVAVAAAGLLTKGYVIQIADRFVLTSKGYTVAYNIWIKLTDEEKFLISGFIKALEECK